MTKKVSKDNILEKINRLIPDFRGKFITINRIHDGITNNNFKIIVGDKIFFLSTPGTNSKLLNIDFKNKCFNNKICGELGLSPKIIYCNNTEELLLTEFISSKKLSLNSSRNYTKLSDLIGMIKILHGSKPFYRNFNMFTCIYHYINILKRGALPKLITPILQRMNDLCQKLAPYRNFLVPCHNDFVSGNIINNQHQFFLVDFDYSGNNDPCFELGNLAVEMKYDSKQINDLVRSYYGIVQENKISRVYLQGIVSDIGWSLWGYVQSKVSSLNYDFNRYAINRLERATSKMESIEYKLWLKNI